MKKDTKSYGNIPFLSCLQYIHMLSSFGLVQNLCLQEYYEGPKNGMLMQSCLKYFSGELAKETCLH